MEGQTTAKLVSSARGRVSDHRVSYGYATWMESIVKNDVFALDYIKFIKLLFCCLGYSVDNTGTRLLHIYQWVVIIAVWYCEIFSIIYVWNRRHVLDFFHLGHLYGNIILTVVIIQRLTMPFQKNFRSMLHKFITEYHLIHFEHESDFVKEEHIRINKFCRVTNTVLFLQLLVGVITYNLMPVYTNWANGWFSGTQPENMTLEHSVCLELPFDYTHEVGLAYYSVVIFTFYPCFNTSAGLCIYDLVVYVMIFHIWGHFNVLAYKLKSFPSAKYELAEGYQQFKEMSKEYNERARQLLKNIIRHYQFIKRFMAELSQAFEFSLFVYLAYHQLHGCVLLLECSALTGEALGKYFVLTIFEFGTLVLVCVLFEQVNSKSDRLPAQLYDIPWEDMDIANRRTVLFLLRDVQNTLSIKALGVLPVGVMTMSAIIKTTISYFLLLNTFA